MANEKKEWTNTWHEDADTDKARVLLIGDSIVNGIQHFLYKLLPEDVTGSAYMTSKGVDSEFFTKEIELTAEQDGCVYEAVYFNSGLHFHSQTPDEYEANYRKRLARLVKTVKTKRWIIGLSTPITVSPSDPSLTDTPIDVRGALPFSELNDTVIEYNKRAEKIAGEFGFEVFDAYSLMEPHSSMKSDSYHYNEHGKRLMAEAVAKKIGESLKV